MGPYQRESCVRQTIPSGTVRKSSAQLLTINPHSAPALTERKFSMFTLLWTLLCGSLIGWVAGIIMNQPGTTLRNIVVGIVGSALGRFLFSLIGFYATAGLADVIVSIIGACVLLALVHWIDIKTR